VVAHGAEAQSAKCQILYVVPQQNLPTTRNDIKIEHLGEFKVEVEMALCSETGDYVGLIHEKNQR
jgi:hypothetical protein